MNAYKLGLRTSVAHVRVGAAGPSGELTTDQYRDAAKAFAAKSQGNFLLVTLTRNAKEHTVSIFDDLTTLADTYSSATDNPGDNRYVAMFIKDPATAPPDMTKLAERGDPVNEASLLGVVNIPVSIPPGMTRLVHDDHNLLLGLGIAVGGLGLAVLGGKKKRA